MNQPVHILIGNTFPMALIRRDTKIDVWPKFVFEQFVARQKEGILIHSYWGHQDTLEVANEWLGQNLTPKVERPALKLNGNNFIEFDGIEFSQIFVLNPSYKGVYRPAIGEKVSMDKIDNWTLLKINLAPYAPDITLQAAFPIYG